MYTWNNACHPDYYFDSSRWLGFSVISHNTSFRFWDACAADVTPGFRQASKNGDVSTLATMEVLQGSIARDILDYTLTASDTNAFGTQEMDFIIDKLHPWVSTFAKPLPTIDQFVGVADLGLCDGNEWKERVKICFELFSTDKVGAVNETNSVQANNCSFGYAEFNLKKVQVSASHVDLLLYESSI